MRFNLFILLNVILLILIKQNHLARVLKIFEGKPSVELIMLFLCAFLDFLINDFLLMALIDG